MKHLFMLMILSGLLCIWSAPVWAQNPFTSKPETQYKAPEPIIKNPIFVNITLWQHQLRQKLSGLIRDGRSEGNIKLLIVLVGLAFLYGIIHAVGPGHGKVVAMSYVLSHHASIASGMIFGICFALIHAFSGAVGVLGLRYIIQRSVSDTLASVTTITQIISYGLISLLGFGILLKHGYVLLRKQIPDKEIQSKEKNKKDVLAWAAAVGLVPCPAVVMVMLFCLSMEAMLLGLLLAVCISIGMATTISFVVIIIIMGKTGIINVVSKNYQIRIETIVGLLSGIAICIFGTLFLLTTINSVLY